MTTLADLTLKLSIDLERLEKSCHAALATAERERDQALHASPARSILERYHAALDKAKQTELQTIEKADETRSNEILAAEDKRRNALSSEERKYRTARQKAIDKKQAAIQKARAKWRDAVANLEKQPLAKQRTLRKSADEALERALEEARETAIIAIEDARLTHRSALQDDLVDERLAAEKAHRKAEKVITGATIAYERAVAQEEARMRVDLTRHPEAQRIQRVYDQAVSEIRTGCEREKEALFREFTRERRRLNAPRARRRAKK